MKKKHKLLTTIAAFFMFAANGFAAESIQVLSFKDGHSLAVQERLGEFEKETGIKVALDLLPAASVSSKILADQLGGGRYDGYLVDEPFMPQLSRFLVPLRDWPAQPGSAAAGAGATDFEGFVEPAVRGASVDKIQYGLPVNGNVYVFIYRSDLYNDPKMQAEFKAKFAADLKPPETPAELLRLAEFFYRPPALYGFAPFTKVSEGTTVEAMWLFGLLGMKLVDDNNQVVMNHEQVARAFEFYRSLMQFAPRGSRSWHHVERMNAYSKGQIAQMMTWPSFLKDLEDPKRSLVVGKTAYGVLGAPIAGSWTFGISKKSKNPASAARFARWWAGAKSGAALIPKGMNPARIDLLTEPTLVHDNPWFPAIIKNFERAQVRPRVSNYRELSQAISDGFTAAVTAGDPGSACADCNRIGEEMLAKVAKRLKK
jgi:multiple sugar transport system substrate-binding protein